MYHMYNAIPNIMVWYGKVPSAFRMVHTIHRYRSKLCTPMVPYHTYRIKNQKNQESRHHKKFVNTYTTSVPSWRATLSMPCAG